MKTKIRKLAISGFRGERHATTLDFTSNYNSMLIFGANAKGKSCIADAMEWFFKGSIRELRKEGCSRTDYRHRLLEEHEDSFVEINFSRSSLNSKFFLPTSLKQYYSNDTSDFARYLEGSKDELLILRHKDLKEFVDESKSYKREYISNLIGMETWEHVRNEMGAVTTKLSKELETKVGERKNRRNEVVGLIGAELFSDGACWDFAIQQASILGFDYEITDLKDLKTVDKEAKAAAVSTERVSKLTQLERVDSVLKRYLDKPMQIGRLSNFADSYNNICAQPKKVLWANLSELFHQGKSILISEFWTEDVCPLCGVEVSKEELLSHIKEHEAKGIDNEIELSNLESNRSQARSEIQKNIETITEINKLELDEGELESLKSAGSEMAISLSDSKVYASKELKTFSSIEIGELQLKSKLEKFRSEAKAALVKSRKARDSLRPTEVEEERIRAFQNLSNLVVHMTALNDIGAEIRPLKRQAESMEIFTKAFENLRRNTMGNVLDKISEDVARYFVALHPDEGFDDVQLKFLPDVDGIEFHIYYKGEEISPPRKFLSESYLSGLGICLFLATVRAFNLVNDFIILDDVVNSFDAEHRAELARLLVQELNDYQLIVLTHDKVWFDIFHRLTKGGWQFERITGWSYEEGISMKLAPADELAECNESINSGSVEIAAPKIRAYMENRFKRLCYKLGVRVRFRPDPQNNERTAGELLYDIRKHLKQEDYEECDNKIFQELEASNFIVNFGSHDRAPQISGLVMGDVKFAFNRIDPLENLFICSQCNKPVWIITDRNYQMNCKCGNLKM